jgi:S1-C subfamily serine protease
MGHDSRLPARLILWLSSAIMALIFWSAQASAQESAHDKIRKSLVYLEASGLNTNNGTKPVTQATGFLVSNDGFILTTYHLLSELGPVAPESVEIGANVFKKASNPEFVAVPVQAMPEFDLLLLKISASAEPFKPLVLGTLADALSATAVNTSGFPKSANYRPDSGNIGSKDTTSGYLWEVNDMPFDFGQSGSPVYTDDGIVVGVAKGQLDGSPGVNYMIPIQFADSLLATIRLSDMQAQIASLTSRLTELEATKVDPAREQLKKAVENIDEIAINFKWSAAVAGDDIQVSFKKLADAGLDIKAASFTIVPIVRGKDGKRFDIPGTDALENIADNDSVFLKPEASGADKRKGVVSAKGMFERLKAEFCAPGKPTVEMDRISVIITPYLDLEHTIPLDQEVVYIEQSLDRKRDCTHASG